MIPHLLKILRESIKAVPAMKYALAVAGLLAVVALAGAMRLSPQAAVIGAVLTLVLMVALVIFARLTTTASRHFLLPVTIMMWAFLFLTIATALVLFTSAFFAWPRSLHELMRADPPPSPEVATEEPEALLAAARQQRQSQDFEGAWRTIEQARAIAPASRAAGDEQAQIAMTWLRELRIREGGTFSEAVAPLTAALHLQATRVTGVERADLQAHLGWANFLRFREGVRGLEIEEAYARAIALDPDNPFAQAMWGHWLATQRRPLAEIAPHFTAALRSGRERGFVQGLRIAAYDWMDTPESALALIRVANEMRLGGEPLGAELRRKVLRSGYGRLVREHEEEMLQACPASENLATFRWVCDERELEHSLNSGYTLARLTEAAGQFGAAAQLYRSLAGEGSSFSDRVTAGLARCEAALAQG